MCCSPNEKTANRFRCCSVCSLSFKTFTRSLKVKSLYNLLSNKKCIKVFTENYCKSNKKPKKTLKTIKKKLFCYITKSFICNLFEFFFTLPRNRTIFSSHLLLLCFAYTSACLNAILVFSSFLFLVRKRWNEFIFCRIAIYWKKYDLSWKINTIFNNLISET